MSTKGGNLEQIANKGDDLETLKALRQKLARTIDESNSGRDISSLSRQLQIVMTQITELEEERKIREEDTILDIVRKKHAQRVRGERGQILYTPGDEDEDLEDYPDEDLDQEDLDQEDLDDEDDDGFRDLGEESE